MVSQVKPFEEILENCIQTFKEKFNETPNLACCAPGRVNLIGEHVDYNDGYVLPIVRFLFSFISKFYLRTAERK